MYESICTYIYENMFAYNQVLIRWLLPVPVDPVSMVTM